MLFLGKKNVFKPFGCLKICFTENQFRCLVRSNIFTENALHSQATQFSIHFLSCKHVDNESIPHSFRKETKPSKKKKIKSGQIEIARRRRRWDWRRDRSGGKIKAARSSCDRRAARCCDRRAVRCCDRRSMRCDRQTGARSVVTVEVTSSSLFAIWALSLSLSLSLSFRKYFEVKIRTEIIFRLWSLILRSNWKYFQFDPIYRTYQTCYFPENDFWISFEVKTNGPLVTNWIILLWVCVGFMFSFGWPFFNCWHLWVKGRPLIGSYPLWHQPTHFLYFLLLLLLFFFFRKGMHDSTSTLAQFHSVVDLGLYVLTCSQ